MSYTAAKITTFKNEVPANIWECMEEHMRQNLGIYGLEMHSKFLDLKEQAEDCKMCPEDTEEKQERLEWLYG